MSRHFVFMFAFLFSSSAHTQTSHIETYNLSECIAMALQKHQSLKVSDAQVLMAEALYQQAMSAYWPRIDGNVSVGRSDQDKTFSIHGSLPISPALGAALGNAVGIPPVSALPVDLKTTLYDRDLFRASINLTYPIFTGLKRPAIINQAGIGVQIAEQGRRKTNLDIVRDVKKYYYAAQFALHMERLTEGTLNRFKILEDITEQLYQNGSLLVKKTDYLRTKTTTALVRSVLNEAVYSRELAHEALGNAMGQPWSDQYRLAKSEMPKTITTKLQELVDAANNFNPEIQQLRLAVQIAKHQITEAQSGYYPMIGVQASAHKLWNEFDGGLINEDNRDGWDIGVGMEWNLFDGFATSGKVNHARAQQQKLKSQRILLDEGMALQVKLQFLRIRSSGKQIKNSKSAFDFAKENSQLHMRAYQQEMVETKDVIEAQLVETFAQSAYFRSRHALEIGLTSLEYLIGQNLEGLSH